MTRDEIDPRIVSNSAQSSAAASADVSRAEVGFVVSAGLLHAAGITVGLFVPGVVVSGIAVSREVPWQRIAIRVVGSWIAAIGILVIGLV